MQPPKNLPSSFTAWNDTLKVVLPSGRRRLGSRTLVVAIRLQASNTASLTLSPRLMPSTTRKLERFSRLASPTPVEPAEPSSLSRYSPAPKIGESPTRPGIFHDRPEVVVVQPRSPCVSSTEQWIVPVTRLATVSRTNAATLSSGGGSQSSLGSRVSFQCSQICR